MFSSPKLYTEEVLSIQFLVRSLSTLFWIIIEICVKLMSILEHQNTFYIRCISCNICQHDCVSNIVSIIDMVP